MEVIAARLQPKYGCDYTYSPPLLKFSEITTYLRYNILPTANRLSSIDSGTSSVFLHIA